MMKSMSRASKFSVIKDVEVVEGNRNTCNNLKKTPGFLFPAA